MIDLDELEKLREHLEDETVKHPLADAAKEWLREYEVRDDG